MLSLFSNLSEKKKENIVNIVMLGSIILTTIILILPLFQEGVIYGDDFPYHIARIEGLANSFKHGTALKGIRTNYLNGYGYGTGFFYCDFFLIVPALVRCIGVPIGMCYKILQALLILTMVLSSWIGFKEIAKGKFPATIGTILFVSSHYFMLNLYARSAVGETTAMVFLPLVVAGLYNLVTENFSKPYLLIIGLAGTCLSHLISTVFSLVLCIIIFLIHIKDMIRNRMFPKIIKAALITLGLTVFYWLPMLEQVATQKYHFQNPWINISEQCVSMMEVMGNARYSVGYFMLLCVLAMALMAEKEAFKRNVIFIIVPAVGMLLLTINPFWKTFENIFGFMQFPWRLLSLITMSFVLFIINVCKDTAKMKISRKKVITSLILLILLNIEMNHEYYEIRIDDLVNIDERNLNNLDSMLGGGKEWLPIEVNANDCVNSQTAILSNGSLIDGQKDNLKFTVRVEKDAAYIDIPFIYYKGYRAYNLTNDRKLKISKSDSGLVRVHLNDNVAGDTIMVEYYETFLSRACRMISIVTLIGCIIFIWRNKKNEAND